MPRNKVILTVEVELDDIEGAFHTPESAKDYVELILEHHIPHYNPNVQIQE